MEMVSVLATRPDRVQEAHEALKQAILSGELSPCAPLAQEDLAARLGVSRQPVSHALALLKHQGLVIDRGRKGLMVAPIEPERVLALYQVRGALDGLAARLAAARRASVAPLVTLLARGTTASDSGTLDDLVEADAAFHQGLYEASGNPAIAEVANGVWPHVLRSMRAVLNDPDYRTLAWQEHAAIVAAIETGDPDKAEALATGHAAQAGRSTYVRLTTDPKKVTGTENATKEASPCA